MTDLRMFSVVRTAIAGLTVAFLPIAAHAATSFAPAVNYATGSFAGPGPSAQSMISVDVNNDGYPDIVAAEWQGTGFQTFINQRDGTFGPAIETSLGSGTNSVASGDFDGDGRTDIAVTTSNAVIIMRGNGNGTFTKGDSYTFSPAGQIVAYTFDVNRDGRLDLVVPVSRGVQTFLGQGNGHFVTGPLTQVTALISALAPANFNNDGIADLVVADASAQQVIMMRGNGDGSFTQFATSPVGLGPEDVIAGDLNGDGIDDIATADSFSFTMSVLLSNGKGGFSPATRYTGVSGPVSLRLADFNHDGRLDIAVASVVSSSVQVYTNSGGGQFSTTPLSMSVSGQPQTPAIADYNLDGKPDIAVAGPGTMSVLRNTSP